MASVSKFKNKSCFIRYFSKMDIWMVLYSWRYIYMQLCPIPFKKFFQIWLFNLRKVLQCSHNPLLKDKTNSDFASLIMGSCWKKILC